MVKPLTLHDLRLAVFKFLGDHSEGVTPVPIPNTEVKPFSADGTAWEAVWESRTLPGLKLVLAKAGIKSPSEMMGFFVSDVKNFLKFSFSGYMVIEKTGPKELLCLS